MPKFSSLVQSSSTIAIKFGGELLNVVFDPTVYTPAFEDLVNTTGKLVGHDAMTEMASQLLVEWDLTDDEGALIPTTVESLRQLPIHLLAAILKPIVETFAPDPKKASS